jgi:hypothetical protein
MKKSIFVFIFLSSVLSALLISSASAQIINIVDAAMRVDSEGVALAQRLATKIVSSEKEFVFKVKQNPLPHVQLTSVSFLYKGQVYTIDFQNDLGRGASLIHNSFIKVGVYPKGQPQAEISFSDYLLNGSWDEHESPAFISLADNVSKEKSEELQKKFLELLKDALEYFE